ncbi:MAG: acid-activated periplasmic chaperone HdeA [Corticimicrobacter sp.]|uniref:acid-activated periplasmic chaperone HdeA n=1 Tax=Corticimicrobacter sp. TaxID=2678536 RepID=UPI0032D9F87E
MKKTMLMLAVFGMSTLGGLAHADTKKPVPLWLCSDYLAVNEDVQPTVLGFAEALNRAGKPDAEVLDIDGVAKLQPVLLTHCKENPTIALHDALVQAWGTIKQ